MGGKHNLYTLGVMGVDLTKSAVHAEEGTLRRSQNAVSDVRGEYGGLTKRDGLTPINAISAGGPIMGVVPTALPVGVAGRGGDPGGEGEAIIGLYVKLNTDNDWARTQDGITWELSADGDFTAPPSGLDFDDIGSSHESSWIMGDGRVIFPAVTANGFDFYIYDGDTATLMFSQATTLTGFSSMWRREDGVLYWCCYHPTITGQHGVFQYANGTVTQLGTFPESYPIELAYHDGALYCGAAIFAEGTGSGHIYKWDGSSWTEDKEYTPTTGAGIDFLSCAVFKNKLYMGAGSDKTPTNNEEITTKLVRLSSDEWSSNIASVTSGRVAALYAYEDELYLTRATDRNGSSNFDGGQIYRSSNGTTWTLDKDWSTDIDTFTCLRVFAGFLWVKILLRDGTFELWRRDTLGNWTEVTDAGTIETYTMFAV